MTTAKRKAIKYTNEARLNRIQKTRAFVRGSICTGRINAIPVNIKRIKPPKNSISISKGSHGLGYFVPYPCPNYWRLVDFYGLQRCKIPPNR